MLSRPLAPVALLAVLLFSGCASYTERTDTIAAAWGRGDVASAARNISAQAAENRDGIDSVVIHLEQGAILRAAGDLHGSNRALDYAEQRMTEYEQKADILIGRAITSNVTNLSKLPYEGYAYDKIMANTYKALNYMEMGNVEAARVELNRAMQKQRNAVEANAERIEKAEADAEKVGEGRNGYDVGRASRDPRLNRQIDSQLLNFPALDSYTDYVNPFASLLDGIFFMAHPATNSDYERARQSFRRVAGMIDDKRYISEDLKGIESLLNGQPVEPATYVSFETGFAPQREETRIDIPVFIVNTEVPYVGAAFPKLRFHPLSLPRAEATAGLDRYPTAVVADMDSVIARDFENEMPVTVTKTLIAAGTKAVSQYALKEQFQDGSLGQVLVQIAGTVYQYLMNEADLRTWRTLPKQFQYARFPNPENRQVLIRGGGLRSEAAISIDPARYNIIYIRGFDAGSAPVVRHFTL